MRNRAYGLFGFKCFKSPARSVHILARFLSYGGFFSEIGVPLNHPFIDGFSAINHPAIAVPPFMETPSDQPVPQLRWLLHPLVRDLFEALWCPHFSGEVWMWVGFWMFLVHYIHYRIRSNSHLSRFLSPWFPMWVWVNTYRYIFRGMNIHLPAILMFTRGTRFWHTAMFALFSVTQWEASPTATASAQPEPHKAPTRHQRKPEAVLRGLH